MVQGKVGSHSAKQMGRLVLCHEYPVQLPVVYYLASEHHISPSEASTILDTLHDLGLQHKELSSSAESLSSVVVSLLSATVSSTARFLRPRSLLSGFSSTSSLAISSSRKMTALNELLYLHGPTLWTRLSERNEFSTSTVALSSTALTSLSIHLEALISSLLRSGLFHRLDQLMSC